MKLSLITVCYNSADTITDTIESVRSQSYPDIEYIVIDGGSTDGTLDMLRTYKDDIALVVSEPDEGIYDAMNKGIALATGDVIGILNSDDFYCNKSAIEKVASFMKQYEKDLCYADLQFVKQDIPTTVVRKWNAGAYSHKKLLRGWIPPHPTVFVKQELYKKYGTFNTDFTIAADYELILRFLLKNVSIGYIPETIVSMREGGYSAGSIRQRIRGWKEIRNAWKVNHTRVPRFLIAKRILSKLHQYVV